MNNALTVRPVAESEWAVMREQAKVLVTTGFLPDTIKTPEQAVAIMLKGRELNIPPMYALSNIVVIKGKPAASAELMLALIYRDHGDDAITFTESTPERCTISYKRRAWTKRQTYTFTIEDAQRAGLAGNQTWRQYPAALLRARCISAVARMGYPDSIGGMYTPEELGAVVTVDDQDGTEIRMVDPTPTHQPVQLPPPPPEQPRQQAPAPTNGQQRRPPTRDELAAAYGAKVNEAESLGIKGIEAISGTTTAQDIIRLGQALNIEIDKAKGAMNGTA